MLDQLAQLVAAVDRLDWRFVRDCDDWYAYFHPDWQHNPARIILADGESRATMRLCVLACSVVRFPRFPRSSRSCGRRRRCSLNPRRLLPSA